MTDEKKSPDKPEPLLNAEDRAAWDAFADEGAIPSGEEDFAALLDQGEIEDKDATPEFEVEPPKASKKVPSFQTQAPQLDAATERKLKRGEMEIEARLDLHRMRQAEAHKALQDFIIASATSNLRCVLVITGKGITGRTTETWLETSKGVLKEKVPQWLQSGMLSQHVLKFFPAQPKHGGTGALYVYLKRQR